MSIDPLERRRAAVPTRRQVASSIETDEDASLTAWSESPIRRAAAGAIGELADLACQEGYVASVADADGHVLWSSDGESSRRASAHWADPGLDHISYEAAVHDPTGQVIGVVELRAHWTRASPLAHTTVRAVARVIELELAADPSLHRSELSVRVLGEPVVTLHEDPVRLSHRQLEVLTLLALHPEGLSLEELHGRLYGDRPVSTSTPKAEISHLRGLLDGAIDSRPYRLALTCDLDAAIALESLARGDAGTALRCYRGPLLPASESPHLVGVRNHLDVGLRAELLRNGSAQQLLDFARHHPYDVELIEQALVVTEPGSALRPEILARLTATCSD